MQRAIRAEFLILLLSVLMMAGYNHSLWSGIVQANSDMGPHTMLFLASCAVFLTALFNLLFNLFALKGVVKPALITLVFSAAVASYFIDSYGVHIDSNMLQNVLETDSAEAVELLTGGFMLHVLLWGLVPALMIARVRITRSSWTRQLVTRVFSMLMSILAMGLVVAFFYQDYASTVRNHRDLRYLINPTSSVYAVGKIIGQRLERGTQPMVPISQQAAAGDLAKSKSRRTIAVLVLGETARAEQFHLNGYPRQTTPELEKRQVINYSHVSSCGTATAVSVPCMFSMFSRHDYDSEKGRRYENVLDVMQAAGIPVVWLDNNSGCKGVCDRVKNKKIAHLQIPEACEGTSCFDESLLAGLKQEVAAHRGDILVVLHQKGSHGPAYHERVPDTFRRFEPVCQTSELHECSQQEIVNAYDNTVLYTDYVLGKTIDWLEQQSQTDNTVMLYVSDHGESLGEKNMYLHGAPYFLAPSQQTRVPMLLWLSDNFRRDYRIDATCLEAARHDTLSHDNLFHSLIGMMDVRLQEKYDATLDIFASCRR